MANTFTLISPHLVSSSGAMQKFLCMRAVKTQQDLLARIIHTTFDTV